MLKYKRQSEELLMQSGLAYTILRPGRLTDGPYTSFDLNTLLQATAGTRQDIQVAARDELNGETSRIALAGMPLMMRLPCALQNFKFSRVVYNTPGKDVWLLCLLCVLNFCACVAGLAIKQGFQDCVGLLS